MKLLLTSAGLMNDALVDALADLLGRPFKQCKAVFIPTAANVERGDKSWVVKDLVHLHKLGWRQLEIIDLAAMASMPRDEWWPVIEQADVFVVEGGNTFYLSYWFEKSGFMQALPNLLKTKVYVGISAGSMVVSAGLQTSSQAIKKLQKGRVADSEYGEVGPAGQTSAVAAKLVDFVIRPHYNSSYFPHIRDEQLKQVAKNIDYTMYAIDDQSAIKVVDGKVSVVSKGEYKLYPKA